MFTQIVEGLPGPSILDTFFTSPYLQNKSSTHPGARKPGVEPGAGKGGRQDVGGPGSLYSEELGFCLVGKEVGAYGAFSKERTDLYLAGTHRSHCGVDR